MTKDDMLKQVDAWTTARERLIARLNQADLNNIQKAQVTRLVREALDGPIQKMTQLAATVAE